MVNSWYPGHMLKARRQIAESLKLVDAVCEIVDARIPRSSRNPDLDELTGNKPRLIVLNRVDQADPAMNKKWAAHLRQAGELPAGEPSTGKRPAAPVVIETDSKSGSGVGQLAGAVNKLLSDKIAALASKGQAGKQLRLMVVGIPNVGKSSFINRAAGRRAAQTSDRPGVTRGQQWIRLQGGAELLDTPGVLWARFDDPVVAENLAFTGAIRDRIMDIQELGIRLMLRLMRHYPERIAERYKVTFDDLGIGQDGEKDDETGFELLRRSAAKRGFLLPGGELDTERMAAILLDEFRGGKLGRITLEWC